MMKSCGVLSRFLQFQLRSRNCNAFQSSHFIRDYIAAEINAILWISLIAITYFLLFEVFKLFRLWIRARSIPGPPCPSFYGHCKLISQGNIIDLLSELHQKYGSVVKLWLSPTQLLVSMKEPSIINEMLSKAEDKLPLTGRALRLAFGRLSLFVSSFEKVQKRRESLTMELNKKLVERKNVIAIQVVDCVMERISGITSKGSINCKLVSQHMACTIMGATLFGDAFLSWSKAAAYEELLMMIAKDACFWASYRVTPFWKQGFWGYRRLCATLTFLTQDILQLCRRNYKLLCQIDQNPHVETTYVEMEASSSVPSYSGVVKRDNFFLEDLNGHLNAREEPCSNVMGVMFHGCVTTAGLMDNILAKLVTHPEIQDKIYSEIIIARKQSQKQDQQNVDQMNLLLATVYESARLLPAGSLLQRCSLEHDVNLKSGVSIPAGAVLVVPVQLVQNDDSNWGTDATKFNPYRFLTRSRKGSDLRHRTSFTGAGEEHVNLRQSSLVLNEPSDNAAFLPFGSGSRACVAQKFVIQGVAELFASLLEQYEIKLQPGSENDSNATMKNCDTHHLPSPGIVFVPRNRN